MRCILVITLFVNSVVAEITSPGTTLWPKFSDLEWGISAKETVQILKAQGFKQDGEISWGNAGAFFDLKGQAFDCDVSVSAFAPTGEGLKVVHLRPNVETEDVLPTAIRIRDLFVQKYGEPRVEKYIFYDKKPLKESDSQISSILSRQQIHLGLQKKYFKLEVVWGPLNPELDSYLSITNPQSFESKANQLLITFQGPDSVRGTNLLSKKSVNGMLENDKKVANSQLEEKKTIEELQILISQGDVDAQFELGKRYGQGEGVERDSKKAVSLYRSAAEKGQAEAQWALGILSLSGSMGVTKDLEEAVKWYTKSAEGGFSEAQAALAVMYEQGFIVEPDIQLATKWCIRAAEQGHVESMYQLALKYMEGQGVPKSDEKATVWLRDAAAAGHLSARTFLGIIRYNNADDLGGSYSQAYEWFLPAAEQGDALAQYWVGLILSHGGDGIAQDIKESARWYRKSAEQGNAIAQFMLSKMYFEGLGVTQDYVLAYMWINLSASGGESEAVKTREHLLNILTKEQIAAGQKLTREWLERRGQ